MTVSELYVMFVDVSDFTKITVYAQRMENRCFAGSCRGLLDYDVIFNGVFDDMPIGIRQSDVVRFSHDYSQNTLAVII